MNSRRKLNRSKNSLPGLPATALMVNDCDFTSTLSTKITIGPAELTLIILLIPYKTIVSIYHRDDPEYVRLYIQYFEEPDNMKYRAEFFEHRREVFKEKW